MFTPERSKILSCWKMTSATQAHTLRVYCSLPRKESLLLWASGKQEVECSVVMGGLPGPLALTDGARLGRSAAAACRAQRAVVTGLAAPWPPSSFFSCRQLS